MFSWEQRVGSEWKNVFESFQFVHDSTVFFPLTLSSHHLSLSLSLSSSTSSSSLLSYFFFWCLFTSQNKRLLPTLICVREKHDSMTCVKILANKLQTISYARSVVHASWITEHWIKRGLASGRKGKVRTGEKKFFFRRKCSEFRHSCDVTR